MTEMLFTPLQLFIKIWMLPLIIIAPITVFRALILSK